MPDFAVLTNTSVLHPSYVLMLAAYNDYLIDSGPCKAGITNQCAVRTSVALVRCGFSLDAFNPRRRVHRGRRRCVLPHPHIVGAHELARYLARMWGEPERFVGRSVNSARDRLLGRTGVVYFNDCFRRAAGGPQTGDHIDLWTGQNYYNQIIRVGAGGDAGAGASLFERADAVWFFPLSA
jgi:hypothetical protein